jgi:acetaldehyde dehydrogenase
MTTLDTARTKVAIIGSGNIGSDLMVKVIRLSDSLEMDAMVGMDPESDGLARARRLGIPTTAEGVDELIVLPTFDEIGVVFDATSARAHVVNAAKLEPHGKDPRRPHPGRGRPARGPGGQPRPARGRPERQHGDVRRAGHLPVVVAAVARVASVR